jgi:hypothetical protein
MQRRAMALLLSGVTFVPLILEACTSSGEGGPGGASAGGGDAPIASSGRGALGGATAEVSGGLEANGGRMTEESAGSGGIDSPRETALGSACDTASECESGYCVEGVCCESACAETCQACGPDGRCNVVPSDDEACGEIQCPASSECRKYPEKLTAQRCAAFLQCITSAACEAAPEKLGTPCGTQGACNGQGGCTLLRNGAPCTSDIVCASGVCLSKQCAVPVTSCAQLTAQFEGAVEISGALRSAAPSTNIVGGAVLLDGDFSDGATSVCLDDQDLPLSYKDSWNGMVEIPIVSKGAHSLRLRFPNHTVSKKIALTVTSTPSPGPTYFDSAAKPAVPAFGKPPAVVVPKNVAMLEPITNGWGDKYGAIYNWLIGGTPGVIAPYGSMKGLEGSETVISFSGSWDLPHHRLNLTISNNEFPPQSWEYIAIMTCPDAHFIQYNAETIDLCGPDVSKVPPGLLEGVSRHLLFFPVSIPAPQALLYSGTTF